MNSRFARFALALPLIAAAAACHGDPPPSPTPAPTATPDPCHQGDQPRLCPEGGDTRPQ